MSEVYFSDLNYTLSNEDTRIELELMPQNADKIFAICGSGARVLPLMTKNPKHIDVVDMAEPQLKFCELRLQAMRDLAYDQYLYFMGYRGAPQTGDENTVTREELFQKIQLRPEIQKYWLERKAQWSLHGFIYTGKWEGHFQKLGKIFREYLKCDFTKIFEAQTLEEQRELYQKHWPHVRWKSFIRVAASEYVFNKFLYKGHFSGADEKRTDQRPPYQMIMEEFERLFQTQLARRNYFMQVLFLGRIRYEEGLPIEAHEAVFQKIKKSTTTLSYTLGDLTKVLRENTYDFVSLSDTISYLTDEDANQILQRMPNVKSGSRVVIRAFLRAPKALDAKGWKILTEKEKWSHAVDGTGVYTFHIFEKA